MDRDFTAGNSARVKAEEYIANGRFEGQIVGFGKMLEGFSNVVDGLLNETNKIAGDNHRLREENKQKAEIIMKNQRESGMLFMRIEEMRADIEMLLDEFTLAASK